MWLPAGTRAGRRCPLWFGGPPTTRSGRRIAGFGRGWLPIAGTSPPAVERGGAVITDEVRAAGRDPAGIGIRVTAPIVAARSGGPDLDATLGGAGALVAAGATCVSFALAGLVRGRDEVPAVVDRLVEGRDTW